MLKTKNFRNERFFGRYLDYEEVSNYLRSLPPAFNLCCQGYSVLKRPIYSLTIGEGKTKVLAWSQMHGNETTSTKALLDFIDWINQDAETFRWYNQRFCLQLIPVLNPDGAVAYTRENAHHADLNRDAITLKQPEARILQKIGAHFKPDFAFNMHDQDSLYGIADANKAAILSLLAPALDEARSIPPSRERALQLIAGIAAQINVLIPGHVGRYKDEFNPNCMGEYFQMQGVSTVLFESGHFGRDYTRDQVRKYVFNAFVSALSLLADQAYKNQTTSSYFDIPLNTENFYDLIIRHVEREGAMVDIGLKYVEELKDGKIIFLPRVEKIGNLKGYYGHKEIEGLGQKIDGIPKKNIELNDIIDRIHINNEIFTIDLTNN